MFIEEDKNLENNTKKNHRSFEFSETPIFKQEEEKKLREQAKEALKEPSEKPSFFGKVINKIKKTKVGKSCINFVEKIKNSVSQSVDKIKNSSAGKSIKKFFTENKIGKGIAKVAEFVTRPGTLSAVGVGVAIASVAIGGPIGVAAVGVAASCVAVGKMYYNTRSTRKLDTEHKLLMKNRSLMSVQEHLLNEIDPKLKGILKDELITPTKEGKKSEKERYVKAQTGPSVIKTIAKTAISNNVLNVKSVGASLLDFASQKAIDEKRFFLKKEIDKERDVKDTPGYNNIRDLEKIVNKQEIQTKALKKLTLDKNYFKMTDSEKIDTFKKIKEEEQSSIPLNKKSNNFIQDFISNFGSKDNKYREDNISKLEIEKKDSLTKILEVNAKVKEISKENKIAPKIERSNSMSMVDAKVNSVIRGLNVSGLSNKKTYSYNQNINKVNKKTTKGLGGR